MASSSSTLIDTTPSLYELVSTPDKRDKLFNLDNNTFVDVVLRAIPEFKHLELEAFTTLDGKTEEKAAPTKMFFEKELSLEQIRGMGGLIAFKQAYSNKEHAQFIESQTDVTPLSAESFKAMGNQIHDALDTTNSSGNVANKYAAIIWYILCNDLLKSSKLIQEFKKIDSNNYFQDIMLGKFLQEEKLRPLVPGFNTLSPLHQQYIVDAQLTSCDISQLEQLEPPCVVLSKLKKFGMKYGIEALAFYFIHSLYDTAGALAHRRNGAYPMYEGTFQCFNALYEILKEMIIADLPIEVAYNKYLSARGNFIGIENNSPENIALIRIAGLARLTNREQGTCLKTAWDKLTSADKGVLIAEFNELGSPDKCGLFIGFGPSIFLNVKLALSSRHTNPNECLVESIFISLKNFVPLLKKTREMIKGKHPSELGDARDGIFTIGADELAINLPKSLSVSFADSLDPKFSSLDKITFYKQPALVTGNHAALFNNQPVEQSTSAVTPSVRILTGPN